MKCNVDYQFKIRTYHNQIYQEFYLTEKFKKMPSKNLVWPSSPKIRISTCIIGNVHSSKLFATIICNLDRFNIITECVVIQFIKLFLFFIFSFFWPGPLWPFFESVLFVWNFCCQPVMFKCYTISATKTIWRSYNI